MRPVAVLVFFLTATAGCMGAGPTSQDEATILDVSEHYWTHLRFAVPDEGWYLGAWFDRWYTDILEVPDRYPNGDQSPRSVLQAYLIQPGEEEPKLLRWAAYFIAPGADGGMGPGQACVLAAADGYAVNQCSPDVSDTDGNPGGEGGAAHTGFNWNGTYLGLGVYDIIATGLGGPGASSWLALPPASVLIEEHGEDYATVVEVQHMTADAAYDVYVPGYFAPGTQQRTVRNASYEAEIDHQAVFVVNPLTWGGTTEFRIWHGEKSSPWFRWEGLPYEGIDMEYLDGLMFGLGTLGGPGSYRLEVRESTCDNPDDVGRCGPVLYILDLPVAQPIQ